MQATFFTCMVNACSLNLSGSMYGVLCCRRAHLGLVLGAIKKGECMTSIMGDRFDLLSLPKPQAHMLSRSTAKRSKIIRRDDLLPPSFLLVVKKL
jgi:hypothetical protein